MSKSFVGIRNAMAVYTIQSKISDGVYVGSSICPLRRWKQHYRSSVNGLKSPIAASIAKYGAENMEWTIVAWYPTSKRCIQAEYQLWLKLKNQGGKIVQPLSAGSDNIRRVHAG